MVTELLQAENLTQEFLKGFETGVLLNGDRQTFEDFSCPKVES